MLSLAGSFRVGTNTVYRDVDYRDGARSVNTKFYVLPDAPRIARDDSGGPAFRFVWYRSPDSSNKAAAQPNAGGMLTVTIDLAPDPNGRDDLLAGIASAAGLASPDSVSILPIPFKSGVVTLSFAGEGGGGDFAAHVAGAGPATLVGTEKAAFAIELTADGAAVLANAIVAGLDILSVNYDLVFEYRLDAIKLRTWCDLRAAHDLVAARLEAGPLKTSDLREMLAAHAVAGTEITVETEIAADQRKTLEDLAGKLLDDALRQALFGFGSNAGAGANNSADSTVSAAQLQPYDAASQMTVNHTFSESYPAEQHATANAVLKFAATPDQLATRMLQVDVSDAMRPLEVNIICAVDFADGLIGAVHLFIEHDGENRQAGDFAFKQGAAQWTFRANAASGELTCRYRATVYYKDGTTTDLKPATCDAGLLVIDAGGLGVLDTTVTLGDVPLSVVRCVPVALEYPAKGLATTFLLDGANPSANWRQVIGAPEIEPYRYRASWLTNDGRRIDDEWRTVSGRWIFLDAPRGIGATAVVEAIAAGDFTGLAQIVLDLRSGSEAVGIDQAQFTFTRPGETAQWRPHLGAPGAALSYQARRTIVGQDGVVQVFEWTAETTPVLVVRDLLSCMVQIVPRFIDLSGAWTLAILDLEYPCDGAAGLLQQQSIVIRERATEPQWSFRLAAPDRRRYRYRLTMVARDGARRSGPWIESEAKVLVVQPPAGS
jgi:hypothetical protein